MSVNREVTRRLLRLREVMNRVPLSRSAIYNKVAAGSFPKPKKIGCRAVAWLESDIDAWIAAPLQAVAA